MSVQEACTPKTRQFDIESFVDTVVVMKYMHQQQRLGKGKVFIYRSFSEY